MCINSEDKTTNKDIIFLFEVNNKTTAKNINACAIDCLNIVNVYGYTNIKYENHMNEILK
ncbi:hypothetical protein G15_0609 [Enterococcus avium]|nr:hypothetical protein G15_0609 [Enterococcus avium]